MIDGQRPSDSPAALDREIEGCWNDPEVHEVLQRIGQGKCYLCEGALDATVLNVDHRDRDPQRRFDWTNLYLAHQDCNNRRRRYEPGHPLLYPWDGDSAEERLCQGFELSSTAAGDITCDFEPTDPEDEPARNTADELRRIHNGSPQSSAPARARARDLRRSICDQALVVLMTVREAREGDEKAQTKLADLLSRTQPFTMLMRSISNEFKNLFD